MPNHRTLRRLARTGHPTLLTVAGHRARAVLPPAPPLPPPAAVVTWCYTYDRDGRCIEVTEMTYSFGATHADSAVAATHSFSYDTAGDLLDPSAAPAAACLPFTTAHHDADPDLCCGPCRCGGQHAPAARWLFDDPLLLDPDDAEPAP
jgi:hypothetical protein